ncbi:hypothetical protein VTL71DRAFT_6231 [Oculimacula yallundae]|uniref:Uncharacterized protein n=1 Tax=Oculimacula yallundae TaxID=86028 RepID=A0ABR4BZS8_9HELO
MSIMSSRPVRDDFNGLPVELRRMIYNLAADRDPDRNSFAPKRIHVKVHSQLRFLPPPLAVVGQQTPEGQFRYDFWLEFRNPAAHNVNFVNQETYRDYLDRYPNVLELRGHHRLSDIVRFNAEIDTIVMHGLSLFILADFATPIASPVGPGGITGQGPPALLRSQQLLGFQLIQRLESNLSNNMAGSRWLQANVLTGLMTGAFFVNNTLLAGVATTYNLRVVYFAEAAHCFVNLPLAWRPTQIVSQNNNSYGALIDNRADFIREFMRIPSFPPLA